MQAISNLGSGQSKLKLVKEMIKLNADYTIQNNEGNNALMLSTKIQNK